MDLSCVALRWQVVRWRYDAAEFGRGFLTAAATAVADVADGERPAADGDSDGDSDGERPTAAADGDGERPTAAADGDGERRTAAADGDGDGNGDGNGDGERPTTAADGERPTTAADGERPTAADGERPTEAENGSGQRSAASGQRSAASGQRSAASGQRSAASGQRSAASGQRSAVSGQRSAASGRRPAASGGGPDVREAVLVEARNAAGAIGLGEAAPLPGRSPDTIADVIRALETLGDIRVASVADVWRVTRDIASPAARFAVETALLGLFGISIARLLCDTAPREMATAIVVDDVATAARAYATGARCLKIKVAAGDDNSRIAAIAAAAPGARLRLDANRSWPAAEVAARLAALRELPIDFVEEPCAQLAQLIGQRFALPIALDESLADADAATLDALLAWPAVGALVVKPTILGGIARCRELAARVDVPVVVSHALEGPIGTAACAELARALAGDCVRGLVRPAGVGAHPALACWAISVPQLDGARVIEAGTGLGLGTLDLARAVAAVPE